MQGTHILHFYFLFLFILYNNTMFIFLSSQRPNTIQEEVNLLLVKFIVVNGLKL